MVTMTPVLMMMAMMMITCFLYFYRDKLFRMKRLLVAVLLRDLSKCHVDHSEIRQKPTLETTSSTVDTKVTSTVDARAKPVPLSDFLSDEKLHHYKQKIEDAEDDYDDGPKDLHCQLPKDCVLSRILRLQILAKVNQVEAKINLQRI